MGRLERIKHTFSRSPRERDFHRLLKADSRRGAEDPTIIYQINEEFTDIVEGITNPDPNPEVIDDIDTASKRIHKRLGHLSIHQMYAVMDAAVISGDAEMRTLAQRTINDRFPIKDTGSPGYEEANRISRAEWTLALGKAILARGEMPFSKAIIQAEIEHDYDMYGPEGFDAVIIKSMNINHEHQRALKAAKGEEVHDSNKETVDLISGIIKKSEGKSYDERKNEFNKLLNFLIMRVEASKLVAEEEGYAKLIDYFSAKRHENAPTEGSKPGNEYMSYHMMEGLMHDKLLALTSAKNTARRDAERNKLHDAGLDDIEDDAVEFNPFEDDED